MAKAKRLWLVRGDRVFDATVSFYFGKRPWLLGDGAVTNDGVQVKCFAVRDFEELFGVSLKPGEVREVKEIKFSFVK